MTKSIQDRYDEAVAQLKKLNNELFYDDFKEKSKQVIESQNDIVLKIENLEKETVRILSVHASMVKEIGKRIEPIFTELEENLEKKTRNFEKTVQNFIDVQNECLRHHAICNQLVDDHKIEVDRLITEVTKQFQQEKKAIDEKVVEWTSETKNAHILMNQELVLTIQILFEKELDRQNKFYKWFFTSLVIGIFSQTVIIIVILTK